MRLLTSELYPQLLDIFLTKKMEMKMILNIIYSLYNQIWRCVLGSGGTHL